MKDIIIKTEWIRRELKWFGACLLAMVLLNAWAIYHYRTPWYELLTGMLTVLALALSIYSIIAVVRIIIALLKKRKTNKTQNR